MIHSKKKGLFGRKEDEEADEESSREREMTSREKIDSESNNNEDDKEKEEDRSRHPRDPFKRRTRWRISKTLMHELVMHPF